MARTLAALAFCSLLPGAAFGLPITYSTALSGPSEFPVNASPGTGTATVMYDPVAHTLAVDAVFSGLTGTTSAAHIHCCVSPSAVTPLAGVATTTPTFPGFPGGVTSGSYSQTFDLTQASSWNTPFVTNNGGIAGAEAALAAGLEAGFAYFNIHTSEFTGGEIRGFLVPEPSTAALLAAGTSALALARRRARAARRPSARCPRGTGTGPSHRGA